MEKVTLLGGRAKRLLPEVVAMIGHAYDKGARCLLVVPEQYTLQAEREVIEGLRLPGFFRIEVLSPSRLTRRIFEVGGSDGRVVIDSRGKEIALRRALMECEKHLEYYQSAAGSQGFAEKVSREIATLKDGGETPETCLAAIEEGVESPSLQAKGRDIATIWAAYEKNLSGRFIDGEGVYQSAITRAGECGFFQDAHFFVYGFDVLPHSLCAMTATAAASAHHVTVAMVMDRPDAADGDIYTPARRSVAHLANLLTEAAIPYEWKYLPYTPLPGAPAIAHLEQSLFARHAAPYAEKPEGLFLYAAPSIHREAHHAAAEILRLHRQGIPFGEIGVVAGDMAGYSSILHGVFSSYGIPFYLADKTPTATQGLVRFLIYGIRAATKGYRREDVVQCIKSGFAPLSPEEGFALENYALAYGIQGGRWQNPFTRGLPEEIEAMEPLRLSLITPLENLRNALRLAKTTTESLAAVFNLLTEVGAYENLLAQEESLLALHMEAEAAKNRQIWQFVLGTLEQMHDLMEGARIPAAHIAAWLTAGLSAGELSALPPVADTVVCGQIGHVMPGRLQVLFAMGLNDGLLDREESGLLSDEERLRLNKATQDAAGHTRDDLGCLARVDLWRSLALPTTRLYLSYSQADHQGHVIRPASIIETIREKLFPALRASGGLTDMPGPEWPLALEPALEGLALRLRRVIDGTPLEEALSGPWLDAWCWLLSHEEHQAKAMALLDALAYRAKAQPLSGDKAKALFGKQSLSVSRLETYAACPYRHFITYGLRPTERREWVLAPKDIGTFFHNSLRAYTEAGQENDNWPNISRAACDALVEQAAAPLISLLAEGPLSENARSMALGKRYLRTVKQAAWIFTKQLQQSGFTPQYAEVSFGYDNSLLPPLLLTLSSGATVMLRGIIDRVDRYEGDEGIYLRVVDYKSGSQKLTPTGMWYGLQLQLLLYLLAASGKGVHPAGAFYFHISDPLVEQDEDIAAAAEEQIAAKLKLHGIALADVTIHRAMDSGDTQSGVEKIFNKDGALKKDAKALPLEQMRMLLERAKETATGLADRMQAGNISISPAWSKDHNACEHCEYAAICRKGDHDGAPITRTIPTMTMDELRERLEGRDEDDSI